jgi:hypothetical protein
MMHSSDESKILDKQTIEGRTTYILQDGVYLGDVFDSLPCGIINKSETGMGATTLELESPRNSIIVEPTKITASSKADKHNALYVGTPTKLHPQQTKITDIIKHVENESIQPKKIVVVADSLYKVIEAIGDSVYQDYHLFLDEIDSFQMDSTFRDSMERCLDYYKKFDPEKRLMVSATLVEFSDPSLIDEPYTTFQYQNPTTRTISLVHCSASSAYGSFLGCVFEHIKSLAEEFPNDKIMIAYNSVSNSRTLANELIDSGVIMKEDVGFLCSSNNRKELGDLYIELDDEFLPKRINFATSAYFTGYDLRESYHLLSVSSMVSVNGTKRRIHLLSDKKLKQIAGRCRETLHSETIVYETQILGNEPVTTIENLLDAAEKEILAIRCLESNYASNFLLSSQLSRIRKLIMDQTHDNEFRLVRRNIDDENVISYLNIDADLENQRVRLNLYQSPNSLINLLGEHGHPVTFKNYAPTTVLVPTDLSQESRVESIREFIETLRSINPTQTDLRTINVNLSQRERLIFDMYEEFHLYIERNQLLDKIEEVAIDRDVRALRKLKVSARIAIMPSNHTYLRRVREHIIIDQPYTNEELRNAWNDIFQSLGLHNEFTDNQGVKALKWTRVQFKTSRLKKPSRNRITGVNPNDFIIIQTNAGGNQDIAKTFKTYLDYYS